MFTHSLKISPIRMYILYSNNICPSLLLSSPYSFPLPTPLPSLLLSPPYSFPLPTPLPSLLLSPPYSSPYSSPLPTPLHSILLSTPYSTSFTNSNVFYIIICISRNHFLFPWYSTTYPRPVSGQTVQKQSDTS